jgi:hypothetical protein
MNVKCIVIGGVLIYLGYLAYSKGYFDKLIPGRG